MKNLVTTSHLTHDELEGILNDAEAFSQGQIWKPLNQQFVTNLFFEPSTRTKCSFEIAQRKLGLDVLPFEVSTSSVLKGETLYDTVKTLEAIGIHAVVIRHKVDNFYNELIGKVNVPIINAGDGCGQHPTQSLLDMLTIRQEFGTFQGLKVAIIGDIFHSRVARSNASLLKRLGANVVFSGPNEWFDESLNEFGSYEEINEVISTSDVVMLLRVQHERHEEEGDFSKQDYHNQYGLTVEREQKMKKNAIIMHPAPVNRNIEIADALVECNRSRIFKAISNGVYIRMAVLKQVLSQGGKTDVNNHDQKWPIAY